MGFLDGLRQVGEFFEQQQDKQGGNDELADLVNFLQYPLELQKPGSKEEFSPKVIRIKMKVTDSYAQSLDIQGIIDITLADYPVVEKKKYLYKNPIGTNVNWSFSPIYKLGKGNEKGLEDLIGSNNNDWRTNKKSRFYKIYSKVIKGFEEGGCFTPGSADKLMDSLSEHADEISRMWSDKKRSYLLVFGTADKENSFIFPGDIPAFQSYFRKKIKSCIEIKDTTRCHETGCSVCHSISGANYTLNKLFKFSTFDKPGFLPGANLDYSLKVFPVCERCFNLINRGWVEIKDRFLLDIGITRFSIFIIPEVFGSIQSLKYFINPEKDERFEYLPNGVSREIGLLEGLAKRNSSFVFHFLFVENNQAQEILHRMIEDIPPTQFKKLDQIWKNNYCWLHSGRNNNQIDNIPNLDKAMKIIMATILSLSGKSDEDKLAMREEGLTVLAGLLGNEWLNVNLLKQAAVERIPGLFGNKEWLDEKNGGGGWKLQQLNAIFELIYTSNERIR